MNRVLSVPPPSNGSRPVSVFTCADFFRGIGGFHEAARNLGLEVVFAFDIDEQTRRAYFANCDLKPLGKTGKKPDSCHASIIG
ncbi:MAG: DNA cytosine methyltransferase [Caldilineaceae bacterium SB0670_bin_27]|uniref:DNA cytosine methyltransferase n=1 Tax=Caldilineaceae bacterium SB0664_bin_27 TaxID=2605260 RepID=A0A6B0YZV5_9CHLR|nr:DNA cytosine methyltransferase [Caldilineaceae bacterium SB0664_bin_27]MYJ78553.1 DNA cytosine methyltransferase [Caldilineaceae bacterium SB0670_bin_27]